MHRLTGKLCPLNYQSGWRLGLVGGGDQRSWSACTVKKCGIFRQALPLTMWVIKCVLIFLLLVGERGGPIPPLSLATWLSLHSFDVDWWEKLAVCYRESGCSCGLGVGVAKVIPTSHLPWGCCGRWDLALSDVGSYCHVLRKYQSPLLM